MGGSNGGLSGVGSSMSTTLDGFGGLVADRAVLWNAGRLGDGTKAVVVVVEAPRMVAARAALSTPDADALDMVLRVGSYDVEEKSKHAGTREAKEDGAGTLTGSMVWS